MFEVKLRDPLFTGKDLKKLIIPLLWETVLSLTIGMLDTVMVSQCGEAAVSGVSLVDTVNILIINLFSALATGGTIVVSRFLGQKDEGSARKASKQLIYVTVGTSIVLTVIGLATRVPLLSLIFGSIEPEVMENAQTYFWLTLLSFPFIGLYNAVAALLRAVNKTKISFIASAVMNLTNFAGNALLIYAAKMGVAGAGLATLLSRVAGAVIMLRFLFRSTDVLSCRELLKFEWFGGLNRQILAVGIPTGFENCFFNLGKLLLVGVISTLDTASIAANAVGNTLSNLHIFSGQAIGMGMVTVVARCIGAKEYGQLRYYVKYLMKICYISMAALNILLLLLLHPMLGFFSLSPEAYEKAMQIVALHGIGSIIWWPVAFVLPNGLRAAGEAKFTMAVCTFAMMAFRMVLGYVFTITLKIGVVGVWMAMQVDWLFRIVMFVWRFHKAPWEKRDQAARSASAE